MRGKLKVSVIIPTYNRNQVLVNTIKSVLKQKFEEYELIIVDQTIEHDKKTEKFIKNLPTKNIFYYFVTPPSLPAARNFGLTKAKADIILYVDDDVLLNPGFIAAHVESYKKKEIVVVVGRIKQKDKPVSNRLLFLRKTSFGAGSFNYPKFAYAETVQGCNMSFKKEILLKIGGFDTNYIGNAVREESDVSFKLRKKGYKILYNPEACLYHLFYPSGGCREGKSVHDNYIIYRNEMLFFLRHRPMIYFPYFFAGHFLKYVLNKELIQRKIVLARLKVFVKGLILGFFVFLYPKKLIVSREIKNYSNRLIKSRAKLEDKKSYLQKNYETKVLLRL